MPEPREPTRIKLKDWPNLWGLTKGEYGIGDLRKVDKMEVINMLLPPELCGNISLNPTDILEFNIPSTGFGLFQFEVEFGEEKQFNLLLVGFIHSPSDDCPEKLLEISDFEARLPVAGGTQNFYKNLQYQLGHMGIPIIFGQKIPSSLGYYLHRIEQVPIGLLAPQFAYIRRRIKKLEPTAQEALTKFPHFSWTVGVYEKTTAELLDPRYHQTMDELRSQFDSWTRDDRTTRYQSAVMAAFNLKDE